MLDQLRKLGLVVEIDNSVVVLRSEYIAAKAGEPLSPEQAKALVHLKQPIEKFKIIVNSMWSNGEFEEFE